MACHLDVIAKQAETTALYVGQARFQILKEQVMRLRARLTGSRFGARRDRARRRALRGRDRRSTSCCHELDGLERDLRRDRRLFLGTASMTDRLIGSGRLPRALVEEYCAVGSGRARLGAVRPTPATSGPTATTGASACRSSPTARATRWPACNVRFGELAESLRLLRQSIDHLRRHDGRARARRSRRRGSGAAFGWAEAPQGELVDLGRDARRARSPGPHRLAVAAQLGAVRPRLPQGRADRLRVHRAQLRADAGGSRSLMLEWIPRGLRKGRVTTRYPQRAGGRAARLPRRDRACSTRTMPPTASSRGSARRARSPSTTSGGVALDRGRCILCGACVRGRTGALRVRAAL